MEMNDFEIGFLASSRQIAHLLLSGRRVVSSVCFFVLILNNAPALRAGNYSQLESSWKTVLEKAVQKRATLDKSTITSVRLLNLGSSPAR